MDLKALDNMNSNGIITAPIRVRDDVAAVLGEDATNVSELCKSNKINKWAKWKPIPYGSIEGIMYEGPNTLYPLCRIGDFNGYNHNAAHPILNGRVSLGATTLSNRVGNRLGVSFFLALPTEKNDTITLHDIQEIQDAYPAVMFCRKLGGNMSAWVMDAFWTSDKPLKEFVNTAISLSVPVGNIPAGTYYIVVCFSKYMFNWDGNWTEAGSYPSLNLCVLPLLQLSTLLTNNRVQITQYSSGGTEPGEGSFSWSCSAELEKLPYDDGTYNLRWSVSINNWGNTDITLSNNYVYMAHADWQYGQALENGETYRKLPNFSKGVDGPGIVASGEYNVDANYAWKIYVSLGNGKYTRYTFAFTPAS